MDHLLYCDEDPFVDSTTTPPPPKDSSSQAHDLQEHEQVVPLQAAPVDDDVAELVEHYKSRQRCYAPSGRSAGDYRRNHLQQQQQQQQQWRRSDSDSDSQMQSVSAARSKAVRYIIYAFGRLGLGAATAFNAVNYLDRFLAINSHLIWEDWMVEVVSIACLSVACKLDEVSIPSLHHLQLDELMLHSFRPSTIRDMELTLLKALQWRLACVTPYSFLHLFILPAAVSSRCTALLLSSLQDPSFLQFDASVVAASALTCVAQHHQTDADLSCHVSRLIHPLCQMDNEVDECFKMMKALHTSMDHSSNPSNQQLWSPISVIHFQTDSTVNRSALSRRLFSGSKSESDDATLTQDEDM